MTRWSYGDSALYLRLRAAFAEPGGAPKSAFDPCREGLAAERAAVSLLGDLVRDAGNDETRETGHAVKLSRAKLEAN